ncbi:MAG: putative peptide zinc metalloprotease protein [Verrucomicrobiales bacterium]|jgi:putative peptide zinc metalloprotease protein
MARSETAFSESWYRVADQNIRLRTGVSARRQSYRGERWFVIENQFNNQFFRLRPVAYEFVARLSRNRTVEEVWEECLEIFPEEAPGQEEVIRLLAQLYHANLLEYDVANDARQLFERFKKRRTKEVKARFTNIMFMRFPLLNPDRFLVRTMPFVGWLVGKLGVIIWLLVVGLAFKVAIDNFPALLDQGQSVLAPGNLLMLYIAMAVTKTLHEFGHAYCCRKYGGEVHVMGIMLLIFSPIPYMDASSSWGFRSKWRRVQVGAAGMIVEIFVAAIAVFIWANTGSGTLHNLAYNMIFVASVSTILFNVNPLLRFDGYYILSDLLEIPNLHQRAAQQLKYVFKRLVFGLKHLRRPTQGRRQATWIGLFGILSNIYRIVVFAGIILFVADRFLILGLIMAVVCITGWIVVPLSKFVVYLASSSELDRNRTRAICATFLFFGGIFAFFQFVPFPSHFRAPGIVQAVDRSQLAVAVPGTIAELLVSDGDLVVPGQPIVRLENSELAFELAAAEAKYSELEARLLRAMQRETADLAALRSAQSAAAKRVARARSDIDHLTVRAGQPGIWIAPGIGDSVGRWLTRGTAIGMVIDPSDYEFTATVVQSEVDRLFAMRVPDADIRLRGRADEVLPIGSLNIIPGEQRMLASPVLGWLAGGEIQTDVTDPEGRVAAEPFFEVHAEIVTRDGLTLFHGRSGKIRFHIGSQPLLPRWVRSLRQLLQKRYKW